MEVKLRKVALISTVPVLLLIALSARLAIHPGQTWTPVRVELPVSETAFPSGRGVEITPQCLICHSAGMVLRQPPLTREEWAGEINKMRNVFGAPLPADQVDALAGYLYGINGRQDTSRPTATDGQGS
ncbi:MAG: c-type cytochrome [Steroidobacteraceae bacterium]